jgi:mono/diheme cytochrome c family protein
MPRRRVGCDNSSFKGLPAMTRLLAASLSPIAIVFALTGLVLPAAAADAANGEILAKRWCASCHIVSSGQSAGNPDVPAFAAIAKRSDLDATKLAIFLMAPHPVMPDMALSRNEAADLAAYIRSQGK